MAINERECLDKLHRYCRWKGWRVLGMGLVNLSAWCVRECVQVVALMDQARQAASANQRDHALEQLEASWRFRLGRKED